MDYYRDYQEDPRNVSRNGQEIIGAAGIPGRDDDKKLFVGGLTQQTTQYELKDYFSKFGEIESITVKGDPYTGQSRGFAFIVFSNPKTVEKLIASGDHYINKKKVDLKRVTKKSTRKWKIFVGGLTPEITDADIKNYFSKYGTILEVQAPFDQIKNQRKNFCFVAFDSKDVVYDLLKTPKQFIKGKEVDVGKVKINPDAMGSGGRGGGQSGRGAWSGGYSYGAYGSGYPQEYSTGYGSTGGYYGYDYGGSYNDYGYGYESGPASQGGYRTKPRGSHYQFQRHQPY